MTVRTESRTTIAGSVREVWAYLCDVGRWPEWAPGVLACWVRGAGPLQLGSRVEQRAKVPFGSTRRRTQGVTAVEAPRSLAFAGPMGSSPARWGMELEPIDDGRSEAMMWIEVDLAGPMRAIPGRVLERRIQRVSDREMAAIKAAVETAARGGSARTGSPVDRTGKPLVEIYRKRADHYDLISRFYPVPGYPQQAHRVRAVRALDLRPGDTVIDVGCGTGLNFPLIEELIGPTGRIIGVDLTDAMLGQAEDRSAANGWSNVSLVHADAADFEFPTGVDAILATYAHALLPDPGQVIARGAAALSAGGRWVVLDLKVPDDLPRWLARLAIATVGRTNALEEWIARRPWEAIRVAMQGTLADPSWTELFFGAAYIAAGSRGPFGHPSEGAANGEATATRPCPASGHSR